MKVLIADDHEVVRQGVRQILADEFTGIEFGEAHNAAELLSLASGQEWDFVLLDINMPGRSGLDALVDLKKEKPKLPVLVLSMFSEHEYAMRAIKAGAAGYICKQSLGRELIDATKRILSGGVYVTQTLAALMAADLTKARETLPHETLSDREYEVMKLIAQARSVKEIAGILSLGEKTIFTYRARMLEKLGLRSDVEVARYAIQNRLVE